MHHRVEMVECGDDQVRLGLDVRHAQVGEAVEDAAGDEHPQRSVREEGVLRHEREHRGEAVRPVVGGAGAAVHAERQAGLDARGPDRVELRVDERAALGRELGDHDPAEPVLLRPVDVLHRPVDVEERRLHLTATPLGCLRAEVDQPAVVGLPPGLCELGRGSARVVVERVELERLAVGEQHLGDDADAFQVLDPELGVPLHLGREVGVQVAASAVPASSAARTSSS